MERRVIEVEMRGNNTNQIMLSCAIRLIFVYLHACLLLPIGAIDSLYYAANMLPTGLIDCVYFMMPANSCQRVS